MQRSLLLAAVEDGRWRPGIGDPTVMGWVTVAAYLVAALGCGLAAWREPMPDGTRRPRSRPSRFWLVLAALMLALGINKQLDLQSLVTQIGRDVVRALGLYSERRELQLGFILAVALVCAGRAGGVPLGVAPHAEDPMAGDRGDAVHPRLRGDPRRRRSTTSTPSWPRGWAGSKWNWILELGGITIVAAAAFRMVLAPPPRPPRPDNAMTYRYRVNSP